jgi:DNA repair exonuclease SbcCD ATPase subunit
MQVSRTRPALLFSCAVAATLCLACGSQPEEESTSQAPRVPQARSLGELSQELGRLQGEVQGKNKEIASLLQRYQEQGGTLPDNFGDGNLTEDQKKLLAEHFKDERLGLGPMLQDILDRDSEIKELQGRIAALESGLPSSVVAQKGDRQDGILKSYLQERGVSDTDARRLIADVPVQPLLPGYRVWAYLKDGSLGSWVTTGDASLSPQELARRSWRQMTDQRDAAEREAKHLQQELATVTRERAELRQQLDVLRDDIGNWSEQVEQLRQEARASRQGARYLAGSKKQLRDCGIITSGVFRRVGVRRLEKLETLDLDKTNEIVLNSNEHGLAQIHKVRVLPDGFRRDQDYSVDLLKGGQVARLSLLDVDKFKRSTFVVVLE